MIVGKDGAAVVISAETAYYLEKLCNVTQLRVRLRGRLPAVGQELLDLREVAMTFDPQRLPEAEAGFAEVDPGSTQGLMSVVEVADSLCLTDRAVRLACQEGRLEAERVGSRWRISRQALENYRATRVA